MLLFCSAVENNFGADSSGMKKISEQIKDGSHISMIINAIHSFYENELSWNELLKSEIAVSLNCEAACKTIQKR